MLKTREELLETFDNVGDLTPENFADLIESSVLIPEQLIINIQDFGSHGDGLTDDTSAIHNAIEYMADSYGTIYFPEGEYLIDNILTIPKNITLDLTNAILILHANIIYLGLIKSPYKQIFKYISGIVDFSNGNISEVIPHWFKHSDESEWGPAISRAIRSCKNIKIPKGNYDISTTIDMYSTAFQGIEFYGEGRNFESGSILKWIGLAGATVFKLSGVAYSTFKDFAIDCNNLAKYGIELIDDGGLPEQPSAIAGVTINNILENITFNNANDTSGCALFVGTHSPVNWQVSEISINNIFFESCYNGIIQDGTQTINIYYNNIDGCCTNQGLYIITGSANMKNIFISGGGIPIVFGQNVLQASIDGLYVEIGINPSLRWEIDTNIKSGRVYNISNLNVLWSGIAGNLLECYHNANLTLNNCQFRMFDSNRSGELKISPSGGVVSLVEQNVSLADWTASAGKRIVRNYSSNVSCCNLGSSTSMFSNNDDGILPLVISTSAPSAHDIGILNRDSAGTSRLSWTSSFGDIHPGVFEGGFGGTPGSIGQFTYYGADTNGNPIPIAQTSPSTNGCSLNILNSKQITLSGVASASVTNNSLFLDASDGILKFKNNSGISNSTIEKINVKDFGAIGDGITDDTQAIQDAIDYCMYTRPTRGGVVFIPAGIYKITDTLHLGYGDTFKSVILEGEGYKYRANSNFCGTAIITTFSDRPAINIQGARGTVVRGICLKGLLYDWIYNNDLAGLAPVIDGTIESNWEDPSLSPTQDERYAPYAGITIDAYSGVRPATSYPDVNYPAFLGVVTQYGKNYSSDILIEDCHILGFNTAVVSQPCNSDGNGDFSGLRRVNIEHCKYGLSVGNSQSRNVSLLDVKLTQIYCGLINNKHGKQIGQFGGAITNLSTGAMINLLDLTLSYSGPIVFTNLYTELIYRIGSLKQLSQLDDAIIFNGCQFNFDYQKDTNGVPANILDGYQQTSNIQFNGCSFKNFPSVLMMASNNVTFNGCIVQSDSRLSNTEAGGNLHTTNRHLGFANNVLCGGVVLPLFGLNSREEHKIKFTPINLDTKLLISSQIVTPDYRYTTREYCVPIYARTVGSYYDVFADKMLVPTKISSIDKNAVITGANLVNKDLIFGYRNLTDWKANLYGPTTGDVIWDNTSDSVFFVTARTGEMIKAEMQNNYKSDGAGGYNPIVSLSYNVGTFYIANSRIYTPSMPVIGNITGGNNIITSCQRDDGYASFLESNIATGDLLFVDTFKDQPFAEYASKITNISNANKTITIDGTARFTQDRKRLEFFVRT